MAAGGVAPRAASFFKKSQESIITQSTGVCETGSRYSGTQSGVPLYPGSILARSVHIVCAQLIQCPLCAQCLLRAFPAAAPMPFSRPSKGHQFPHLPTRTRTHPGPCPPRPSPQPRQGRLTGAQTQPPPPSLLLGGAARRHLAASTQVGNGRHDVQIPPPIGSFSYPPQVCTWYFLTRHAAGEGKLL